MIIGVALALQVKPKRWEKKKTTITSSHSWVEHQDIIIDSFP
jgi:hypothetical protein